MTRVGVVDLGTNSTRLLVADVENGTVQELERRLEITRLGEGVDERRQLLPQAIARVRNVLVDYRRTLEGLNAERTLAFATSAVRDAENGEAFLGEIEWSYDFRTRLLSGNEEALLTFRGVSSGRAVAEGTLVVDVGGGSTELILGGSDGVAFHESLDLGCVRLTERFKSDPPAPRELTDCAGYVQSLLNERVPPGLHATRAIGVAGTVTTPPLDLDLEEEDPGARSRARAEDRVDRRRVRPLARTPVAKLRERRGLHPERAPVIVAGAVVVLEAALLRLRRARGERARHHARRRARGCRSPRFDARATRRPARTSAADP